MDNGESYPPEGGQQQSEERKGIIDRANNAVSNARQLRARVETIKNASKNIQRLRTAATVVRTGALAANPWFWVVVVVVIIILLLVIIIAGGGDMDSNYEEYYGALPSPAPVPGDETTPPSENPIPGLTLEKTGPSSVENGTDIIYTITTTYNGTSDVTIYDKIPENTQFLSATGTTVVDNTNGIVSWKLNDNSPVQSSEAIATDVFRFTLTVRPTQDDIIVENSLYATAPGGTTGPAPETSDFEILMAGQGRNIHVLGNEDNFVNTTVENIIKNFPGGRTTYEPYLRDIYRISVERNINPAIVLTIWGVEQSFGINGREFGCKPFDTGFATQVNCSTNTLDHWMNRFEEIKASGTFPVPYTIHETCTYTDPFIYAYEAYTPVCSMNDSNDSARKNFVDIYKQTLYGVQ